MDSIYQACWRSKSFDLGSESIASHDRTRSGLKRLYRPADLILPEIAVRSLWSRYPLRISVLRRERNEKKSDYHHYTLL